MLILNMVDVNIRMFNSLSFSGCLGLVTAIYFKDFPIKRLYSYLGGIFLLTNINVDSLAYLTNRLPNRTATLPINFIATILATMH